ncbi:hypothetical protein G6553_03665 [Nocardioides sp. IC4_145]|uniref:hypothetical protein n=1 Tax=Nocardioides sp. IC4_145 TaxID=2714037 RepID=UPI001408C53B|nr:hypothetical protein [Nocardioides sp. IC4_145]NHC22272.1 hypothetical protein [Nocardioides sp. IC4_145]
MSPSPSPSASRVAASRTEVTSGTPTSVDPGATRGEEPAPERTPGSWLSPRLGSL